MRPQWAGYYDSKRWYTAGEVVVAGGRVYMAKGPTMNNLEVMDWAYLGRQENSKIDHYYHPEGIRFPLPTGELSDQTYVCSDCWANNNFAAAFMPDEHRYLINELP